MRAGANAWARGETRANPRHKWDLWLPSLIVVIDWCATNEADGAHEEVGVPHWWALLGLDADGVLCHEWSPTCITLWLAMDSTNFCTNTSSTKSWLMLTLANSLNYWMRLRNARKLGDAFESLGAYLLFQDNPLALMEYMLHHLLVDSHLGRRLRVWPATVGQSIAVAG